ncbi:MAG: carboxyl transferase domain-containing protein [Acidimicrobiales bacterium]
MDDPGIHELTSPLIGTVVRSPTHGDHFRHGDPVVVIESMKMEHPVLAPFDCVVLVGAASPGDQVEAGQVVATVERSESVATPTPDQVERRDSNALDEVRERRSYGLDENRPDAVGKRHRSGRKTAREYIAALVDPGTFVEYGPLVLAAQRSRRGKGELISKTPGDGLVGGIGEVNHIRCLVMTYDYMVLAGTQGHQNHRKKDRLFDLAERMNLPVILFVEGGGGRPGETDGVTVAGLDCLAFALLAQLASSVPVIGINTGYCFAGNAALFGMCDVRVSTVDGYVGMAGPAMIEGGGLGIVAPTEIGPTSDQSINGVLDIVVADEDTAITTARNLLVGMTGAVSDRAHRQDAAVLRHLVPDNRREIYDMRVVLGSVFDRDSVVEVRPDYGKSAITAFARFEGRPLVVIANDPKHLGGAIDTDSARSISRMLRLAEKLGLPVAFFCDTPGFMVGPEEERAGLVDAAGALFVDGAALSVPFLTVVTRKGYGLGAQAMAGGGFKQPIATVAWPTSEFGGMGLEGFIKLGYRDELGAIEDDAEREARYQEMVSRMYDIGKGLSMADHFEIDDVIDPAETADWLRLLF